MWLSTSHLYNDAIGTIGWYNWISLHILFHYCNSLCEPSCCAKHVYGVSLRDGEKRHLCTLLSNATQSPRLRVLRRLVFTSPKLAHGQDRPHSYLNYESINNKDKSRSEHHSSRWKSVYVIAKRSIVACLLFTAAERRHRRMSQTYENLRQGTGTDR